MSVAVRDLLTPEDYFAAEASAVVKSEYVHGEVFAMSTVGANHARVATNIAGAIHAQIRGGPCEQFNSDLRVQVEEGGAYFYPDLSVACGGSQIDAFNNLTNPTLIVEVLSPSTEAWDRGGKFANYRQIPSLREYVLVSQSAPQVEVFTRRDDDTWLLRVSTGIEAAARLASIGCELSLGEIYWNITFEPTSRSPVAQEAAKAEGDAEPNTAP